jgi:glucose-1-phosphatase
MANITSLKNILFDMGGVIIDLNVSATLEAFYNMGFPAELLNYPENYNTDIFYRYETGAISTKEFRDAIRKETGLNFEDAAFDKAWRAMLLGIPAERIELIKKLKEKYNLYILSNTSPLHTPVFETLFLQNGGISMKGLFNICFYSNEIGFSKPDDSSYRYVLENAGIVAEETLFLDDNIQNIKAAQALGFNAIHISEHRGIEDLGFDL